VIGGGLGGLTAANRLAYFGRKVLLVEQHFVVGGLAAYFKRPGGHIFDVALHGFPYGMVKTCRKYWSREIADAIVQLKRIIFDNPQFKFETTFDKADFSEKLITHFKISPDTVQEFFTTLRAMNFYDDQTTTTRELFNRFFHNRNDVMRFLMEPITYANGSTIDEPAITYGIVFSNFMDKGVFTFQGGTDWLIQKMIETLECNGVDILLSHPVEKVIIDSGRAAGVRIHDRKIHSKSVLSNANLKRTILELIGEENLSEDFSNRTKALRLSNSSCQVYFGIREGEVLQDVGDLLFTSVYPEYDSDALCSKNVTSRTYSFYYPKIRPSHNRYTVVASMNSKWADWANLSDEEYAKAKSNLAEVTLQDLETRVHGIREKINHIEVATPKTFFDYTGHLQGASFGTKFEGLKISEGLQKEIRGMFHTGSAAIIMSGWLGAANYGVIVANQVEEYLC